MQKYAFEMVVVVTLYGRKALHFEENTSKV
jgi:hypothetical protein